MNELRWRPLFAIFLIAGTASAIALRWWSSRGNNPVPIPLSHVLMIVVVAAVVVVLGLRIRRYVHRHEAFDAIGATRTLALAQAVAITGVVHIGYFAAQLGLALPRVNAPDPRTQAWLAAAGIIASVILVGAGLLAQWCCRVPDDDDDSGRRMPTV